MEDTLRNASLQDLAVLLRDQHTRKLDAVVPAAKIRSEGGLWVIDDVLADMDETGVTSKPGTFRPTDVADDGISDKLSIPRAYLRRMRESRPDLYDANVNGWLHGKPVLNRNWPNTEDTFYTHEGADGRSFLVRTFVDPEGGEGVARALLSDRFKVVDNLDVLTAALDGVRRSGVEIRVESVDLTDRRMYVKISAPAVAALAPGLLADYVSPYSRLRGADNPTVFAGFVLSNSEVGGGAFTLTPRIVIEICTNGMTFTADALRNVHLGGRMDEGVIVWSEDTRAANLELVTSQARDAVATFLTPEYLEAKIALLERKAGEDVGQQAVETIVRSLSYTAEQTDAVLDAFIRGGQTTLGGVAQAITAAAQRVSDADVASEMESQATELLLAA